MSDQSFEQYERDEEMLEARRLRRLEMKRKRQIQQRIILASMAAVLVLLIALIARGCSASREETPVEPPVEQQEVVAPPPVDPDVTATLAAVGDIMIYDELIADAKQEDLTYNFDQNFATVAPYLSAANLTVGNLELNFSGNSNYAGKDVWNAPETLAVTLKNIGFDILQTANTFSIHNGMNGLSTTIDVLTAAGIDHVGTYADSAAKADGNGIVVRSVNGIKFAFVAFTKGLNGLTLPSGYEYSVDVLYEDYDANYSDVFETAIKERLDAAKSQEPDVLVAMLHWGSEYEGGISKSQEEITELMLKNGVDVILGSHSHIAGPMEVREVETTDGETKECFVAYSLGNFYSFMPDKDYAMESLILNLEFTKSGETGETTVSNAEYLPLYILDHGEEAQTRFEVVPIRKAMENSTFAQYNQQMLDAIDHLEVNTKSSYDSGK